MKGRERATKTPSVPKIREWKPGDDDVAKMRATPGTRGDGPFERATPESANDDELDLFRPPRQKKPFVRSW